MHLVALRCCLRVTVVFLKPCMMQNIKRRTSSIFNFVYFDFAGPKPWASSFSNWLQARFAGEHCKARTRGLTREGPHSLWKPLIKQNLKRKLRNVAMQGKDYNTAHALTWLKSPIQSDSNCGWSCFYDENIRAFEVESKKIIIRGIIPIHSSSCIYHLWCYIMLYFALVMVVSAWGWIVGKGPDDRGGIESCWIAFGVCWRRTWHESLRIFQHLTGEVEHETCLDHPRSSCFLLRFLCLCCNLLLLTSSSQMA